jgi:hypothetical protein
MIHTISCSAMTTLSEFGRDCLYATPSIDSPYNHHCEDFAVNHTPVATYCCSSPIPRLFPASLAKSFWIIIFKLRFSNTILFIDRCLDKPFTSFWILFLNIIQTSFSKAFVPWLLAHQTTSLDLEPGPADRLLGYAAPSSFALARDNILHSLLVLVPPPEIYQKFRIASSIHRRRVPSLLVHLALGFGFPGRRNCACSCSLSPPQS